MKSTSAKHIPASLAEAAWAVALRLRTFGYAQISAELRITMEKATQIVRGWEAEGAVLVVEGTAHGPGRKKFRADGDFVRLPAAGRTAEDNMWTGMRKLRSFAPSAIAAHATTDQISVSVGEAAAYCRALLAAEYLTVTRRAAPTMKREAIYRLALDTGPKAPVPGRVRALRDPNTGEVVLLRGEA